MFSNDNKLFSCLLVFKFLLFKIYQKSLKMRKLKIFSNTLKTGGSSKRDAVLDGTG